MVLRTAVVWMLVEFLAVGEVLAPLLAAGITLPVAYVLTALVMRGRSPGGTGSGQRLGVPAAAGVVPASRTAA